jgi:VCBS repeat-containing protein
MDVMVRITLTSAGTFAEGSNYATSGALDNNYAFDLLIPKGAVQVVIGQTGISFYAVDGSLVGTVPSANVFGFADEKLSLADLTNGSFSVSATITGTPDSHMEGFLPQGAAATSNTGSITVIADTVRDAGVGEIGGFDGPIAHVTAGWNTAAATHYEGDKATITVKLLDRATETSSEGASETVTVTLHVDNTQEVSYALKSGSAGSISGPNASGDITITLPKGQHTVQIEATAKADVVLQGDQSFSAYIKDSQGGETWFDSTPTPSLEFKDVKLVLSGSAAAFESADIANSDSGAVALLGSEAAVADAGKGGPVYTLDLQDIAGAAVSDYNKAITVKFQLDLTGMTMDDFTKAVKMLQGFGSATSFTVVDADTATFTVTLPVGRPTLSFQLPLVDDAISELGESLTLTMVSYDLGNGVVVNDTAGYAGGTGDQSVITAVYDDSHHVALPGAIKSDGTVYDREVPLAGEMPLAPHQDSPKAVGGNDPYGTVSIVQDATVHTRENNIAMYQSADGDWHWPVLASVNADGSATYDRPGYSGTGAADFTIQNPHTVSFTVRIDNANTATGSAASDTLAKQDVHVVLDLGPAVQEAGVNLWRSYFGSTDDVEHMTGGQAYVMDGHMYLEVDIPHGTASIDLSLLIANDHKNITSEAGEGGSISIVGVWGDELGINAGHHELSYTVQDNTFESYSSFTEPLLDMLKQDTQLTSEDAAMLGEGGAYHDWALQYLSTHPNVTLDDLINMMKGQINEGEDVGFKVSLTQPAGEAVSLDFSVGGFSTTHSTSKLWTFIEELSPKKNASANAQELLNLIAGGDASAPTAALPTGVSVGLTLADGTTLSFDSLADLLAWSGGGWTASGVISWQFNGVDLSLLTDQNDGNQRIITLADGTPVDGTADLTLNLVGGDNMHFHLQNVVSAGETEAELRLHTVDTDGSRHSGIWNMQVSDVSGGEALLSDLAHNGMFRTYGVGGDNLDGPGDGGGHGGSVHIVELAIDSRAEEGRYAVDRESDVITSPDGTWTGPATHFDVVVRYSFNEGSSLLSGDPGYVVDADHPRIIRVNAQITLGADADVTGGSAVRYSDFVQGDDGIVHGWLTDTNGNAVPGSVVTLYPNGHVVIDNPVYGDGTATYNVYLPIVNDQFSEVNEPYVVVIGGVEGIYEVGPDGYASVSDAYASSRFEDVLTGDDYGIADTVFLTDGNKSGALLSVYTPDSLPVGDPFHSDSANTEGQQGMVFVRLDARPGDVINMAEDVELRVGYGSGTDTAESGKDYVQGDTTVLIPRAYDLSVLNPDGTLNTDRVVMQGGQPVWKDGSHAGESVLAEAFRDLLASGKLLAVFNTDGTISHLQYNLGIDLLRDGVFDPYETVTVSVEPVWGGEVEAANAGNNTVGLLIHDAITPVISLGAPSATSIAEGTTLTGSVNLSFVDEQNNPVSGTVTTQPTEIILKISGDNVTSSDFGTLQGSQGVDYWWDSGALYVRRVVPAGQTSVSYSLPTVRDDYLENAEKFKIEVVDAKMGLVAGGTMPVTFSGAYDITLTDPTLVKLTSVGATTVTEGAGLQYHLELVPGTSGTAGTGPSQHSGVTVQLTLKAYSSTYDIKIGDFDLDNITVGGQKVVGALVANSDGTLTLTVTIPAGAKGVDVVLPTANDNLIEGQERLTVTVKSAVAALAVDPTVGGTTANLSNTGSVGDYINDANMPRVKLTEGVTVEEGVPAGFTLQLLDNPLPSGQPLTVTFTVTGENVDWTALNANPNFYLVSGSGSGSTWSYTIPGGASTGSSYTLPIPTVDNDVVNRDKTVTLQLKGATVPDIERGSGTVSVTMADTSAHAVKVTDTADVATVSLDAAGMVASTAESGAAIAFAVKLDHQVDTATTVDVELSGGLTREDFASLPSGVVWVDSTHLRVTINANTSAVNVSLTPKADTLVEGTESVQFHIVSGSFKTATSNADTQTIENPASGTGGFDALRENTALTGTVTVSDTTRALVHVLAAAGMSAGVTEGAQTANFTVSYSPSTTYPGNTVVGEDVLVTLQLDGSGADRIDWAALQANLALYHLSAADASLHTVTVIIPQGSSSSITFNVPTVSDGVVNTAARNITAAIVGLEAGPFDASGSNQVVFDPASAEVGLNDAESARVQLTLSQASVEEGDLVGNTVTLHVAITEQVTESTVVTVTISQYERLDWSAINLPSGVSYDGNGHLTLTIPAGSTTPVDIVLQTVPDFHREANASLQFSGTAQTGSVVLPGTTTLVIANDDITVQPQDMNLVILGSAADFSASPISVDFDLPAALATQEGEMVRLKADSIEGAHALGTVTVNPDGSLTYTTDESSAVGFLDQGTAQTEHMTYQLQDGVAASGVDTHTPQDSAPASLDVYVKAAQGSTVSYDATTDAAHDANDYIVVHDSQGAPIHAIVNAGAGDDTLIGGHGNDTLFGGAGNDIISGGAGDNVLAGGLGSDTFVYRQGDLQGKVSGDVITDFTLKTSAQDSNPNADILDVRDLLLEAGNNLHLSVSERNDGKALIIVGIDQGGEEQTLVTVHTDVGYGTTLGGVLLHSDTTTQDLLNLLQNHDQIKL